MKINIWMPLYVGDYLKDTTDLSHAEHGAYLLTMLAYWSAGESLPDRRFRSICGKEFERVSEFYSLEGGRWHHKRIDEELAAARERMTITVQRSRLGVLGRRRKLLPPEGDREYEQAVAAGASAAQLEAIINRWIK